MKHMYINLLPQQWIAQKFDDLWKYLLCFIIADTGVLLGGIRHAPSHSKYPRDADFFSHKHELSKIRDFQKNHYFHFIPSQMMKK